MKKQMTSEKTKLSKSDTYKKGGSGGSKGVDFQVSLLTVVLLNALGRLTNWKLSTENKNAGKFDDVVLECTQGDVLLQAKFRENKKRITLDELLSTNSKNDDFSLPKYFLSYQEIKTTFRVKNVIICTNTDIQERALPFLTTQRVPCESMLHHEHDNLTFYTLNEDILPKLGESARTYSENNLKGKEVDESAFSVENLRDFLNHFQIYANYPPQDDTGKVIEQLLSVVRCSTYLCRQVSPVEINAKVLEWFQRKDGVYLTRTHALAMFSEIQFDKYWQTLDQYNISFQSNDLSFPESKQILHFSVKGGSLLQELRIFRAFYAAKAKTLCINSDHNIEMQKYVLEAFALPKYSYLLCIGIEIEEDTVIREIAMKLRDILDKYSYKRIIMIAKERNKIAQHLKQTNNSYIVIKECITLNYLSDDTRVMLLGKKNIIFQGKEVTLQELATHQTDLSNQKAIDSDLLEKLVTDRKIQVGLKVPPLDENVARYYIDRTFERKIKIQDDRQEGSTSLWRRETFFEGQIYEVNEKLIIIADSAGSGKTTVLTKLAWDIKKNRPHLWIIKIDLSNYTQVLRYSKNIGSRITIRELLNSKTTTNLKTDFDQFVFSIRNKVVLLLDGLDEVSPDYTDLLLDLLAECHEEPNFAKIFVTTRPHITPQLEKKLHVKPFKMIPFMEENQVHFLTNYWKHNLNLSEVNITRCEMYAEALLMEMSLWTKLQLEAEYHFAAIPLQVKMLAEIFQETSKLDNIVEWDGCKEYLIGNKTRPKFPNKMNITKLYKMFIEKKKELFLVKENPSGHPGATEALEQQFERCLSHHRYLALEVILDKNKSECFSHYQEGSKDRETNLPKMGILQKFGEEFNFVHRTFAEYFVAESVLMKLELQPQNQNIQFQKFFFEELLPVSKYRVIRTFFDDLLQKTDHIPSNTFDSYKSLSYKILLEHNVQLIHQLSEQGCVAILELLFNCINFRIIQGTENTWENLFQSKNGYPPKYFHGNVLTLLQLLVQNIGVNIKDQFDFTPLHKAARNRQSEMVQFLVEKGANVNTTDRMKATPLHYAVECKQLDTVKFLVNKGADIRAKNSNSYTPLQRAIFANNVNITTHLFNVLNSDSLNIQYPLFPYAAAYLGRLDILKTLVAQGLNIYTRLENEETLIFGAARGDQADIVEYLVQQGADINNRDQNDNTILHIISSNSFTATTKLTVELGVDVSLRNSQGRTALHCAVGCLDTVTFLLESGASIDDVDESGQSAICLAALWGHLDTFKYLFKRGANFNIRNNHGDTVLHLAVPMGQLPVIKFLIEIGVNVDLKNDHGLTALHSAVLHSAAQRGHLKTVEALLGFGADVTIKDSYGRSVLHSAVWVGEITIVRFLVDFVDVNVRTCDGQTALHLGRTSGRDKRQMVECLLELGADVGIKDNNGRTALHAAVLRDSLDVVKLLVVHGIDLKVRDNKNCTALHLAALQHNCDIFRYFLEDCKIEHIDGRTFLVTSKGDRIDFPVKSILSRAPSNSQKEIILLLEKFQVDIDTSDDDFSLALKWTIIIGELSVVKYFVEHGTDINKMYDDGSTALHNAAWNGKNDIVKYLLEHGANFDRRNRDGETALHSAAFRCNLETVKLFIECGIDVNITDNKGCTALHFAILGGQLDIVQFLLELGMDINLRDRDGATMLHHAAKGLRPFDLTDEKICFSIPMVKFLIERGIDVSTCDYKNLMALHYAVSSPLCQLDVVKCLANRDDIGQCIDRSTALHIATLNERYDIVQFLIQNGANVNIRDTNGYTALHLVVRRGLQRMVEHLVNLGIDITIASNDGRTALHFAALEGLLDTVKFLLGRSANVNITDNEGSTPLHLSALQSPTIVAKFHNEFNKKNAYRSVLRLLVEHGADINRRNMNGHTAAMVAREKSHFHLLRYLEAESSPTSVRQSLSPNFKK